jgi:hypothetical protein
MMILVMNLAGMGSESLLLFFVMFIEWKKEVINEMFLEKSPIWSGRTQSPYGLFTIY